MDDATPGVTMPSTTLVSVCATGIFTEPGSEREALRQGRPNDARRHRGRD